MTLTKCIDTRPRFSRLLGPGADAPEVVRIAQRHDAAAVFLGPRDAQGHRLLADDLAEARVAIQPQQCAGVQCDADLRVGLEIAFQVGQRVTRQHADAVRVMARQVGFDQVADDGLHFFFAAAEAAGDQAHGGVQGLQGYHMGVAHTGLSRQWKKTVGRC
jgi:hypothetical protein